MAWVAEVGGSEAEEDGHGATEPTFELHEVLTMLRTLEQTRAYAYVCGMREGRERYGREYNIHEYTP